MPKNILVLSVALFLAVQVILLLSFMLYVNGKLIALQKNDEQIVLGINTYINSQKSSSSSSSPSPQ